MSPSRRHIPFHPQNLVAADDEREGMLFSAPLTVRMKIPHRMVSTSAELIVDCQAGFLCGRHPPLGLTDQSGEGMLAILANLFLDGFEVLLQTFR